MSRAHRSELQCLSGLHYSEIPVRQRHRRSGLLFLKVSLNVSLQSPLRLFYLYIDLKVTIWRICLMQIAIEYCHLSMLSCTVLLSGWWHHRQSHDHVWLRAVGSDATHLGCSPTPGFWLWTGYQTPAGHMHARCTHAHQPKPVTSTITFPLEGLLMELLCWWWSGGRFAFKFLECCLVPPFPAVISIYQWATSADMGCWSMIRPWKKCNGIQNQSEL